jgi:hypothetical protein
MTDSLNNNLSLQHHEGGKSANMRGTRKKLTIQEMLNFKGNINDHEQQSAEPRYSCPETGAHFKFENMC